MRKVKIKGILEAKFRIYMYFFNFRAYRRRIYASQCERKQLKCQ